MIQIANTMVMEATTKVWLHESFEIIIIWVEFTSDYYTSEKEKGSERTLLLCFIQRFI